MTEDLYRILFHTLTRLPFFCTRALSKKKTSPFALVEYSTHSAIVLHDKVSRNMSSSFFKLMPHICKE